MKPAELAIYHAMVELEKTGADVRLTKAGDLLKQAKDLISDYLDDLEVTTQGESQPENPPPVKPKP